MKRVFHIFLPMFLLARAATSQSADVRGVVSDSSNGERVPFASVMLHGTEIGTATDINGFYMLTSIPSGEYEIMVSSIGFLSSSQRIVVGQGVPVVVNIELPPRPVAFSDVVVMGQSQRMLEEISTSIHVLDVAAMRAVPVAMQSDVFRSIKILPGVMSTSDVNTHFYVRGGAGDQNLILLDGMRIYNPFHAFGLLSIFDADIIRTTEVYTGAFPPGYGGRLSSVVNMRSKQGNTRRFSGEVEANLVSSKLRLEGPLVENVNGLFSGRISTFASTLARAFHKDLPISFYDAFLKIQRTEPTSNARLGVHGFFSGDKLRGADERSPDYTWRNSSLAFSASGLIGDRLSVEAVLYDTEFEARRDPRTSSTTPASSLIREGGIRSNATLFTNSTDLYHFGFEIVFPQIEYKLVNNLGTNRILKSSFVDLWAWTRYEARFDKLRLDGGIHIDLGSLFARTTDQGIIQPRLNIGYQLTQDWRAKISYGRFSQHVITVNNEDDVISVFDAWIRVPDNINSETADHYVFGIDGNITPTFSTGAQVYYKHFGSLVAYNRDKIDATDPDYIQGTGRSYGVELLTRFGVPVNDLYGTYTIGWAMLTNGSLTYPPAYDRRHTLKLLNVLHLTENLDLTVRWEYGSGLPFTQSVGYYDRVRLQGLPDVSFLTEPGTPYIQLGEKNSARLPSYHRLDIGATYVLHIGDLEGEIGVYLINVYDQKNVLSFDRETGEQINMLPFFPSVTISLQY